LPKTSLLSLLLALALAFFAARVMEAQELAPQQPADVVRINTELVQTDVMVFDKQGRFVEGLQPEQFELQVDGKRQPISFFEMVKAGSEREEAQLIAARGGKSPNPVEKVISASTSFRGRTVLFFVDDLHISPGSMSRIRKTLVDFIDNKLAENDQVAITSASGRIGFLQQLTDNKAVLRAAVDRINYGAALGGDFENPPMSEYAAFLIVEHHDSLPQKSSAGVAPAPTSLFDYFVVQTMKANNVDGAVAVAIVERRAKMIVRNSAATNKLTLITLGNLMQSLVRVPGRKLVVFMSDGFVPNYSGSDIADTLHRAAEAASAAGVVIYSIDSRGLSTDPSLDASSSGGADPYGILASRLSSEISATQEPLHAVASATGGRALLNTNALKDSIGKALNETSSYYLLAWRPDSEDKRALKSSKIKITIAGRPDLEVKLRRGYLGMPSQQSKTKVKASGTVEADDEILGGSVSPSSGVSPTNGEELPTSLFVGYKRSNSNTAQLMAFIGVGDKTDDEDSPEKSQDKEAQVVGVVFDSRGKPVGSFRRGVVIPKTKGGYTSSNYQVNVPPGLYQVRVFAREKKDGRLGFAHQWIEIPDAKTGQLSLSSLYLGEITEDMGSGVGASQQVSTSVSRRFAQASTLRFTVYIYEASHAKSPPALSVQTRILRGGQPLVTTPERKVAIEMLTGFTTIPYSAQFALNKLPVGRYRLEVTIADRSAKSTASQQTDFIVY
jgi:VWFA-related protein